MEVTIVQMPTPPDTSFRYIVGETYETQAGELVTIVERSDLKGYECVKGDDEKWRYDRSTVNTDFGRCTGTAHDYSHPDNFVRTEEQLAEIEDIIRKLNEFYGV